MHVNSNWILGELGGNGGNDGWERNCGSGIGMIMDNG